MMEIVYYVAMSLDGYIATPDGGVAWLALIENSGVDHGYADFYASVDAVLLGRRTYEQILGFGAWPYPGKPCWVFSQRALAAPPPTVTVTARTPAALASDLRAKNFRRVWLVGGAMLAAAFRAERLISEYIIGVIPTILGAGIPLFGANGATEQLQLVDCKPFASGMVLLHYRQTSSAQQAP
jgi:dihydrofolate reductase